MCESSDLTVADPICSEITPFSKDLLNSPLYCSNGTKCEIDCSSEDCHQRVIDGSNTTELVVDCAGSLGCIASRIICPSGDNTSCTVLCTSYNFGCYGLSIETADDNHMDTFHLECSYPATCQSLYASLESASINTITIDCVGRLTGIEYQEAPCISSLIKIAADYVDTFHLLCHQTGKACFEMEVDATKTTAMRNATVLCMIDAEETHSDKRICLELLN